MRSRGRAETKSPAARAGTGTAAARTGTAAARTGTAAARSPGGGLRRGLTLGWLPAVALAWLAATLWSVHGASAGSPGGALAVLALHVLVSASLVAGAAVGLGALEFLGPRVPALAARLPARLAITAGGGLVSGAACAVALLAGFHTTPATPVLTVATAVAGLLGGSVAALGPTRAVRGALVGTLAWFLFTLLQSGYSSRLLRLFGAGDTLDSWVSAAPSTELTVALLAGLVAGLAAFFAVRRDTGLRWPGYLLAGAGPGALILLTEAFTRIGGARLLHLAGQIPGGEVAALRYLGTVRVETAEVLLFVGAITTLVASGLSMGRRSAGADS